MTTPTAYKPTSYAPTNVTNGTSGSTTPESQRNAAMQIPQSGSTSNPYAEAVTHTLNWMQYQLPPVDPNAARMGTGGTLPGAAPLPNMPGGETSYNVNATLGGGYQAAASQIGSQSPGTGGTTPPPGGAPPPAPGTTPPTAPPGTAPPPPAGYDGSAQGGRGRPTDGSNRPNSQTNQPDEWVILKANEAARTPGFEWLQQDPWAWQAYAAEMQNSGGKDTRTFAEWAVRNWSAIEQHYGFSAMDRDYFRTNARNVGLSQAATRLRNELWASGNKEDTQWVTGDLVGKYEDWAAAQFAAGKPGMDFWTWAGSVNREQAPTQPSGLPPWWEGGGRYGQQQPGGGAPTGGGTPAYDPKAMEDFIRSLREQGAHGRDAALRQFRHEAGLSGLNDMGAYNPALADLIQSSIRDENSSIYEIINAKDEGERNRALQKYIAELESKTGIRIADIGANAQISSAGIGAGAQMYDADVRRMLGLAGLDVDRENNWWQNQNQQQDFMLRLLQMIYGASGDSILGGNPMPGGDTVVN